MSTGRDIDDTNMLLTQASYVDYEELSRLDVMGLQDVPERDPQAEYVELV